MLRISKAGHQHSYTMFFTAHDFINMLYINLMKRLSILTKGLMIPLILAISSSLDKIPVLDSEID